MLKKRTVIDMDREVIEEIWLKLASSFSTSDYQISNSTANQVDVSNNSLILLIIKFVELIIRNISVYVRLDLAKHMLNDRNWMGFRIYKVQKKEVWICLLFFHSLWSYIWSI
jgi:hypothetical protein